MEQQDSMSARLRRISQVCGLSIAALWVILFATVVSGDPTFTVRNTTHGKIQGYIYTLKDGQQVERYLGVPYATPPVDDLRFELPSPPASWSNVRKAITLPPACMQSLMDVDYISDNNPDYDGEMNEDCLYLNLYIPRRQNSDDKNPMAVLIHVHGGSNEVGMGAMFHGDVTASLGEIIVVTFNYRLSVLGFLSIPSMDIRGNFGLHDQVMAFRWVQDNIANFGGDPAKVTIQGHSAGSIDVSFHVMSPLSKGLFRYAILLSGSPTAYWALLPDSAPGDTSKGPLHHLGDLGCHLDNKERTLACLRKLNVTRLIMKSYKHEDGHYNFSPVVDRMFAFDAPAVFLSRKAMPGAGKLNAKSLLIGLVKDEGTLTAEVMIKTRIQKGGNMTQQEMKDDDSHPEVPEKFDNEMLRTYYAPPVARFNIIENLKELSYYVYKPWSDPDNATAGLIALADLAGDATFTAPAIEFADLLAKHNSTNLYMYRFEHRSIHSLYPEWMGVPHGDDLFYIFGNPIEGMSDRNYTELDRKVSRALIHMWASYVKYGRPSNPLVHPVLLQYGDDGTYIRVSSNETDVVIDMDQRLRAHYTAYWNSLIPRLEKRGIVKQRSLYKNSLWVMVGLFCTCVPILAVIIGILIWRIRSSPKTFNVARAADTSETDTPEANSMLP